MKRAVNQLVTVRNWNKFFFWKKYFFLFQYKDFVCAIERLTEHPFSYRVRDFIFKFRVPISNIQSNESFSEPEFDEHGKAFVEAIGRTSKVFLCNFNNLSDWYNGINP
jgi:hypothetical protein